MFEDVPEELSKIVRETPDAFREPNLYQFFAATAVNGFYLQEFFGSSETEFLKYRQNRAGYAPWQNTIRIVQIAQAVFQLRNEPGFPEICRRLRTRDLRSAFFEAYAAQLFRGRGFSVLARPETKARGEDFDFAVGIEGQIINVEATAFKARQFGKHTIKNALGRKRRQVPRDKPAVIVCFLPHTWRAQIWDLDWELRSLAEKFLNGTGRINRLMFAEDVLFPSGEAGGAVVRVLDVKNARPRIPVPQLDRQMETVLPVDEITREFADNITEDTVGGSSEFFRWVEWCRNG